MIQEKEARREDEPGQASEASEGATVGELLTPDGGEGSDSDVATALDAARAEAESQRELALRTAAELENVRRRAERDVGNAHRYGIERFARELLPVKDSMEMGLKSTGEGETGEAADGPDAVSEGFRATLKLLDQCFAKYGIEEVDPVGDAFDPELHEAMAMQPSAEVEANSVLMVVQKGYRLHDRLLRPARVIVARAVDE